MEIFVELQDAAILPQILSSPAVSSSLKMYRCIIRIYGAFRILQSAKMPPAEHTAAEAKPSELIYLLRPHRTAPWSGDAWGSMLDGASTWAGQSGRTVFAFAVVIALLVFLSLFLLSVCSSLRRLQSELAHPSSREARYHLIMPLEPGRMYHQQWESTCFDTPRESTSEIPFDFARLAESMSPGGRRMQDTAMRRNEEDDRMSLEVPQWHGVNQLNTSWSYMA